MSRIKRIQRSLKENFSDIEIEILDISQYHKGHNNFTGKDETHLRLTINSINHLKMSKVEIHRKINTILKDEFHNGLHALEIKIIN